MHAKKRWSKDEDLVLLDQVKRTNNLSMAMKSSSSILGRSATACYKRYTRIKPVEVKQKQSFWAWLKELFN